jgi:hypothetical protein
MLGIPQCIKQACYLDLYLGGPEDDSIGVETCSPVPMLMYTVNKLLCSTDMLECFNIVLHFGFTSDTTDISCNVTSSKEILLYYLL